MSDEDFNPNLPIHSAKPGFYFLPADHERDVALNSCSLAAQGLHMRLLCLMHRCRPYGHLAVNGQAMPLKQLAAELHCTRGKTMKLIGELLAAKVLHRDDAGLIFNKRLVRDHYRKQAQIVAGKEGAEFGHMGAEYGVLGGRPTKAQVLARKLAETALAEEAGSYPKPPPSVSVSVLSSPLSSDAPAAGDEKEERKREIAAAQAKVRATADAICKVLRSFAVPQVKPHAHELHRLVRMGVTAEEVRSACAYLREIETEGAPPKGANYIYATVAGWRADAEAKRLAAEQQATADVVVDAGGGVIEPVPADDVTDVVSRAPKGRSKRRAPPAPGVTVPSTMTGTTTYQDTSVPAPIPDAVKALKAKLRPRAQPSIEGEKAEVTGAPVDAA